MTDLKKLAEEIENRWLKDDVLQFNEYDSEIIRADLLAAFEAVQKESVSEDRKKHQRENGYILSLENQLKEAQSVILRQKESLAARIEFPSEENILAEIKNRSPDWVMGFEHGMKFIRDKRHAPDRCKHDVHGTDCFQCFPSAVEQVSDLYLDFVQQVAGGIYPQGKWNEAIADAQDVLIAAEKKARGE